jgi:hypothetical protein
LGIFWQKSGVFRGFFFSLSWQPCNFDETAGSVSAVNETAGSDLNIFVKKNPYSLSETTNAESAVSLALGDQIPWFQWDRTIRKYWSHIRNSFSSWIRALGGDDWWNKSRVKNLVTLSFEVTFSLFCVSTLISA